MRTSLTPTGTSGACASTPRGLFFRRRPWVRHDDHLHLDFR
ncbi:MAG: hypothetical protein AAF447_07780 [Myxococcota bacterium]